MDLDINGFRCTLSLAPSGTVCSYHDISFTLALSEIIKTSQERTLNVVRIEVMKHFGIVGMLQS